MNIKIFNLYLFSLKLLSLSISLTVVNVFAHPSDGPQVTQHMAIKYNSAILDKPQISKVYLKYYLLPKEWIEIIKEGELPVQWIQPFIDPDFPEFFRFPIHPSDHYTGETLKYVLKNAKISIRTGVFRTPLLLTESRSLYPFTSPDNQPVISMRLSITDGNGLWGGRVKDENGQEDLTKLISASQARFAVEISSLIDEKLNGVKGKYFEVQPDRMAVVVNLPGIKKNALGFTLRDIESVKRANEYAYPGFASVESNGALGIALLNDYSDEVQFFIEKEGPIRGRAWAEFIFTTGLVHSSPHSQNSLTSTDLLMRLNGRMLIRDLSDLLPTFFALQSDVNLQHLFNRYRDTREALSWGFEGDENRIIFRSSIQKGNLGETIINNENSVAIERSVQAGFVDMMEEMSGVEKSEILKIISTEIDKDYYRLYVATNSEIWNRVKLGMENYKRNLRLLNQSDEPKWTDEDSKTLEIVNSIKNGQITTDKPTSIVLRAALIAYLQGYDIDNVLLQNIQSYWTLNRIKKSKNSAWVISALAMLQIVDPEIIPHVFDLIQSRQARFLALKAVVDYGSIDVNIKILKLLSGNRDRFEIERYRQYLLDKLKNTHIDFFENEAFVEALYFHFKSINNLVSLHSLAGLKLFPDAVLNDMARSEGKVSIWYIERLFRRDPRHKEFLEKAKRELDQKCVRAIKGTKVRNKKKSISI